MNAAVLFGLGTMIAWGFWIALGNIASSTMDPETAAFVSYATATVATGIYVVASDASFVVTNRGLVFAGAAGVAAAVGVVSTFVGVTVGPTSIVSTIGGMYFITAAVIGVIAFGESMTLTKAAGIGLALIAIVIINQ
ncbi:EamA family transporter [Haloarcula sp. CBA1130]|uniref:EamA family transporter n=1 Tax=unclassified Haloarcula TaxID=2624677 RepID=UPI001248B82D|nr:MULTISPECIES: EamA family transporter [unclassified Haloarcula]KAA9395931.1 EamA family transporter [Haloarcula sp. CBA1129]KAA9400140.1 EamA family transporter [Haloarcula sp. CBA1130]